MMYLSIIYRAIAFRECREKEREREREREREKRAGSLLFPVDLIRRSETSGEARSSVNLMKVAKSRPHDAKLAD